jgi:hypothetical protein
MLYNRGHIDDSHWALHDSTKFKILDSDSSSVTTLLWIHILYNTILSIILNPLIILYCFPVIFGEVGK